MSNTDFGILLGLAYQRFVVELNQHLAAKGFKDIKPTFGYLFRALDGRRLTTAQLAARLQITSQGMAKIVEEAVSAGYLERQADPSDARVKLLGLAPRGLAALKAARAFHRSFETQLGEDGKALRALLTDLVERDGALDALERVLRPF
jgi:DNA-binding MarR family transcriptional regulator